MKEIGAGVFVLCQQLKKVQLNEGLEKLGNEAFSWSTIESIRFPSTLKRIEFRTLNDSEHLKSVEIPNGVEYIGKQCFWFSRLEQITLPSTLREIGEDAFKCCSCLKTIWVEDDCTVDVKKYVDDDVEVRCK